MRLLLFIMLAVLPLNLRALKGAEELADVIERCERSVVRIEVQTDKGDGLGSGFVVGNNIIATNLHVLAGAKTARAIFPDRGEYRITGVLAVDARRDITIATIQGPGVEQLPVLPIAGQLPRKGESVFALGSPLGLSFTATVGVISATRSGRELSEQVGGGDYDGTWIQIDAALSAGNSGGPIINKRGQVVAMSTLASQGAQNLNFGISGVDVQRMLEHVRTSTPTPLAETMEGMDASTHGAASTRGPRDIPLDAVQAYVKQGQQDFVSIKANLLQEIGRLRKNLREMRTGLTSIPESILRKERDAEVVRANDPRRRNARVWFFRSQQIKDEAVAAVSERLKGLEQIRSSSTDPEDRQGLFALLWQYGPPVDTRNDGSVGFLSDGIVVNPRNEHEVLVMCEDAVYLLNLDSTTGLSIGHEITPCPVLVNGTVTVELPDGGTTSLTVLQAVARETLQSAIASSVSKSAETAAEIRTWTDRTGRFSVEAAAVQVLGNEVALRRRDGKIVRVPIEKLSDADQQFLRQ